LFKWSLKINCTTIFPYFWLTVKLWALYEHDCNPFRKFRHYLRFRYQFKIINGKMDINWLSKSKSHLPIDFGKHCKLVRTICCKK
jgi:hypothetical protein